MTALPLPDLLLLLAALVAAGLAGGFVAGLFGVGGGTVIVPAVFYAFEVLGVGGEEQSAHGHRNLPADHRGDQLALAEGAPVAWRGGRGVLKTWTPWVGLGGA
jgi:hypothetical protein